MIYRFGVCTLDTQTHELHREGQIVPLQPKVFQVLTYLIEHRHRLVTKQELLEHVWQSQFVHDSVIARCIMAARKAIGDREGDPQSIITLRSQGYRFTADVIDHGEATPHAAIQEVQVASLSPLSPGQDSPDWFRVSPSPATLPAPEAWRLASSIHTVERKWVTVLCCTLVGTTMHEGHTPAGQHNLLHAFLDLAIPEVRRYGGTLQSVMPEGFLVLFGAPIAYEDHAQRAILAALGLRRCLHAWYTRAGFSRMQEPTLRLGLHTGLMMVGRVVDDIPMSYAAGEIPDLAIQLASGAAPGTIVTSATTARLVRSIVRVVALSPDGAGPPPPLPSYQVCAVTPRHAVGERFGDGEAPAGARACEERTHAPTQSRQLTRFVGRQRELATLHALLQLAKVGRGQVVSIVGEPGMGKSRLLYEFHRSLQQQRVTYLAGECVSYGRTIPYLPVLDVLQHHCGITADDADAVIIAKVQRSLQKVGMAPETWAPALLQLLGVQHKTAGGDLLNAPTMKRQIFEAFHQMVLNGSRQQPCIVVIEDLHWIDPTSKEYVEMLVDRLPGAAILLLTTFRPGYQPAWMGKSYATQIALQPLGAEESRQVVHSILHTTSAAHTLVPPILAKAEGNPLFLEELARHTMTPEAEPQQSRVPDTLQSLLAARIDRLSLAEKHMLHIAAVIGTDVPFSLFHAMTDLSEELFRHSLSYLQSAELLYETRLFPEQTYTFKHRLLQEAIWESLPQHTQQQLHERIAQLLMTRFPEMARTQPERLARHYTGAGRSAEAADAWQRAGQYAIERCAYAEAVHHLKQGLDVLETLPDTPERTLQALRLQTTLGAVLMVSEGYAASSVQQVYTRTYVLCQQVDDPAWLLPVLRGLLLNAVAREEMAQAHTLGAQLLTTAQRLQSPEALMPAHCALGITLLYSGEPAPAYRHLEQGLRLHASHACRPPTLPCSDSHVVVSLLYHMALSLWFLGYPDQAVQRSQEALAAADLLASPLARTSATVGAAILSQLRGAGREAQQQAEIAIALATTHGFAFWLALGHQVRGWAVAAHSQGAERLAQIHQSLALIQATGSGRLLRPLLVVLLAEAYGQAGQVQEGITLLTEALTSAHTSGACLYEAELYRLKGELLLQHAGPHTAPAEACLQRALDVARQQRAKSLELRTALSLCRLWQQQGKCQAARQLLHETYGWFTEGFGTADLVQARALLDALT